MQWGKRFVRLGKRILLGVIVLLAASGLLVATGSSAQATTAGYLKGKVFLTKSSPYYAKGDPLLKGYSIKVYGQTGKYPHYALHYIETVKSSSSGTYSAHVVLPTYNGYYIFTTYKGRQAESVLGNLFGFHYNGGTNTLDLPVYTS